MLASVGNPRIYGVFEGKERNALSRKITSLLNFQLPDKIIDCVNVMFYKFTLTRLTRHLSPEHKSNIQELAQGKSPLRKQASNQVEVQKMFHQKIVFALLLQFRILGRFPGIFRWFGFTSGFARFRTFRKAAVLALILKKISLIKNAHGNLQMASGYSFVLLLL